MPEVFRFFGYSFFFYSREHEPIHIHIEGNDGYAIYDLEEDSFIEREQYRIKKNDLKKIERIIFENKEKMRRGENLSSLFCGTLL